MAHTKTPEERTRMMSLIRSRETVPELAVRRAAHRMGYRFRLCRKELPGTPDLVFASLRKVIFVHGCFWHMHGCKLSRLPKSNLDYWIPKFKRNRGRDRENLMALSRQGWKHLVIWECESKDICYLQKLLKKFLG
jgi:DNA mismatch endonuclease (patch repair protein)